MFIRSHLKNLILIIKSQISIMKLLKIVSKRLIKLKNLKTLKKLSIFQEQQYNPFFFLTMGAK